MLHKFDAPRGVRRMISERGAEPLAEPRTLVQRCHRCLGIGRWNGERCWRCEGHGQLVYAHADGDPIARRVQYVDPRTRKA